MNPYVKYALTLGMSASLFGCVVVEPTPTKVQPVYPDSISTEIINGYFQGAITNKNPITYRQGSYYELVNRYDGLAYTSPYTDTNSIQKNDIAKKIISDLLLVHLKAYNNFIDNLRNSNAYKNMIYGTGALALNQLSIVINPGNATKALSGASGFLTGANDIRKNQTFEGYTVAGIISAMDALRAPIRKTLDIELETPNINLHKCLVLLEEYEAQANIEKALAHMNDLVSTEKQKHDLAKQKSQNEADSLRLKVLQIIPEDQVTIAGKITDKIKIINITQAQAALNTLNIKPKNDLNAAKKQLKKLNQDAVDNIKDDKKRVVRLKAILQALEEAINNNKP